MASLVRKVRLTPAQARDLGRRARALRVTERDILLVSGVTDDARWRRLARDALVAAHVRPGDVLWTTSPRDFARLGVAPEQLVAV